MAHADEASTARSPRLYIVNLHLPPGYDRTPASFRTPWILVDDALMQHQKDSPVDDRSTSSAAPLSLDDLQFGDLIFFGGDDNMLLTGAGEFESCRFVGERDATGYHLVPAGIEGPVFPSRVVAAAAAGNKSLRLAYEPLFQCVLRQQNLTLKDLFGGASIVEEYWQNPDVRRDDEQQRLSISSEKEHPWSIPVACCQLLEVVDPTSKKEVI